MHGRRHPSFAGDRAVKRQLLFCLEWMSLSFDTLLQKIVADPNPWTPTCVGFHFPLRAPVSTRIVASCQNPPFRRLDLVLGSVAIDPAHSRSPDAIRTIGPAV